MRIFVLLKKTSQRNFTFCFAAPCHLHYSFFFLVLYASRFFLLTILYPHFLSHKKRYSVRFFFSIFFICCFQKLEALLFLIHHTLTHTRSIHNTTTFRTNQYLLYQFHIISTYKSHHFSTILLPNLPAPTIYPVAHPPHHRSLGVVLSVPCSTTPLALALLN